MDDLVDYDLRYDPNDITTDGRDTVRVSRALCSVDPEPGDEVWAGDEEEPRLHAVVVGRRGDRVELQLDFDHPASAGAAVI
ncbi:MAG TPA: hypothetical protein VG184_13945 [Acidimicrobiales bacterium]|nr:hypothetical protein [Acidimicrobiales bacterium]